MAHWDARGHCGYRSAKLEDIRKMTSPKTISQL